MNALECRTLTAECMTPDTMYSMPVTIIYPQSHCVCLFMNLAGIMHRQASYSTTGKDLCRRRPTEIVLSLRQPLAVPNDPY
jgi:hypothetical protein